MIRLTECVFLASANEGSTSGIIFQRSEDEYESDFSSPAARSNPGYRYGGKY